MDEQVEAVKAVRIVLGACWIGAAADADDEDPWFVAAVSLGPNKLRTDVIIEENRLIFGADPTDDAAAAAAEAINSAFLGSEGTITPAVFVLFSSSAPDPDDEDDEDDEDDDEEEEEEEEVAEERGEWWA